MTQLNSDLMLAQMTKMEISPADLAAYLNTTKQTVCRYLDGTYFPKKKQTLENISKRLKIPMNELIKKGRAKRVSYNDLSYVFTEELCERGQDFKHTERETALISAIVKVINQI